MGERVGRTLWRSPASPRDVDQSALRNPAAIRQWLSAMTLSDRLELSGRADTQTLLGEQVVVTVRSGLWAKVVVPDQPTPLDARGYPGWVPVAAPSGRGAPVAATALRPGDLLFYATDGYLHHVSMYAGNGFMVQSPHTGASVETIPVSPAAYAHEYFGARRYLGYPCPMTGVTSSGIGAVRVRPAAGPGRRIW